MSALWTPAGVVENCNFTNNKVTAGVGGAIHHPQYSTSSVLTVLNSNFVNNSASTAGGAINWEGPTGTVNNSNFFNNTAGTTGGAIHLARDALNIFNSVFENNTAGTSGDAFYVAAGLSILLTATTISIPAAFA